MNIIFDIETVGCDFNSLAESQQEFLTRHSTHDKEGSADSPAIEEAERFLSLYPLTAKVVAIGLLNTETQKEMVLYEGADNNVLEVEEKNIKYKSMSEEEMLKTFWIYSTKAEKLISFNGRNFDIPFLMLRSAIHRIKPARNFMKNRYDTSCHIDLLEQFTFYGLTKKFNLDFYCRAFGIESPKSKGVTGMEIKELYSAGKIEEIAIYCGADVRATFELYKIWDEYLRV